MLNFLKNNEVIRISNAVVAGTSDIDCTAVDCHDCEEVTCIALFGAITGSAVTSIKAAQSSDSGGSPDGWSDLAGSSVVVADDQDNKAAVLTVVRPTKRYVRFTVARGTQNAVVDGVIAIKSKPREAPVAQGATVIATSKAVISPAEGTA